MKFAKSVGAALVFALLTTFSVISMADTLDVKFVETQSEVSIKAFTGEDNTFAVSIALVSEVATVKRVKFRPSLQSNNNASTSIEKLTPSNSGEVGWRISNSYNL